MLADLTVFILDSNEPSATHCRRHLLFQKSRFYLRIIYGEKPIGAAFNAMLNNCVTKYYVQVDADMLLKSHAIQYLYDKMKATTYDTAFFCGWLWGDAEKQPIQGVKIFRHEIIEEVPYGDDYTYDFRYNQELKNAGFKIEIDKKPGNEDGCLGLHWSLQTPLMAYRRWHTMATKAMKFPEHYGYVEKIIPQLDNEAAILGAKHAKENRSIVHAESALKMANIS